MNMLKKVIVSAFVFSSFGILNPLAAEMSQKNNFSIDEISKNIGDAFDDAFPVDGKSKSIGNAFDDIFPVEEISKAVENAFTKGAVDKSKSDKKEASAFIKKTVFGNGFEHVLRVQCSEEFSSIKNGQEICKRRVVLTSEFFDCKENSPKKITLKEITIYFTYDKNGKVWIEDPRNDIKYYKEVYQKEKWKTYLAHDINQSSSECIVSISSALVKSYGKFKNSMYIDGHYTDVICTPDGDIRFELR